MPGRNDPDVLEQEAEELTRMWREESGIENPEPDPDPEGAEAHEDPDPEGDDTPNEPEQSGDEPTDDPSETGEESAEGDDDEQESGSSDVEELQRQLKISDERYKNAQARMTKATQEAADLRKEVGRLEGEVERLKAKPESGPDPDKADLSELEKEYPDIVGPLVQEVRRLRSRLDQSDEERASSAASAGEEQHFAEIAEKHSDWQEVVQEDDFLGWLDRQTPTWKRIYEGGTSAEVIEMLDRYKKAMGLVNEEPEPEPEPQKEDGGHRAQDAQRVRAAKEAAEPRVPRARKPDPNAGQKIWTTREIDALSLSEWERLEPEIDRAALEGRIRD